MWWIWNIVPSHNFVTPQREFKYELSILFTVISIIVTLQASQHNLRVNIENIRGVLTYFWNLARPPGEHKPHTARHEMNDAHLWNGVHNF